MGIKILILCLLLVGCKKEEIKKGTHPPREDVKNEQYYNNPKK